METASRNKPQKGKAIKIITVSLIIFVVVLFSAVVVFTVNEINANKICPNVYINNFNVSGMSEKKLRSFVDDNFKDNIKDMKYILKAGSYTYEINASALSVVYDTESAIKKALDIGCEGSIFKKAYDILNTKINSTHITVPVNYKSTKLNALISSFYTKTYKSLKQYDLSILEDKVILRSGQHSEKFNKKTVFSQVDKMIRAAKSGNIYIKVISSYPQKMDVDVIYKQIDRDPINSTYKIESNVVTILPDSTGRKIDKAILAGIINELEKAENTERILPVELIKPDITMEDSKKLIFKDTLATMTTYFSTNTANNRNRAVNIKLASSFISGKILAPGEVFSFNDTVGPRSASGGYQIAHVYSAGVVIDGIGGGICQVSTTLYNAVLKADLTVVERRNHMFTVGYVPFGQDSTVSYNTADFKFKNSTNWPIRIETSTTSNTITFKLIGTNETPYKTIRIINNTIRTIPYTTKYIDDPTMLVGKSILKQSGENGYVIVSYKETSVAGKVVSTVKMYTSSYIPLPREIIRGTKPIPEPVVTPVQTPTPALPQTQTVQDTTVTLPSP